MMPCTLAFSAGTSCKVNPVVGTGSRKWNCIGIGRAQNFLLFGNILPVLKMTPGITGFCARTAVMGPQQAADTMALVMQQAAERRAQVVEPQKIEALKHRIVANFERQMSAFYTSSLLLDDGVIDPRDTRAVLALTLDLCHQAEQRSLHPIQYGVARP